MKNLSPKKKKKTEEIKSKIERIPNKKYDRKRKEKSTRPESIHEPAIILVSEFQIEFCLL